MATYSNHHSQNCFLPQCRYQYLQAHHPQYIIRRRFANATLNQVEIHRRSRECCMTINETTRLRITSEWFQLSTFNLSLRHWKLLIFINYGTSSKVREFWFRVPDTPRKRILEYIRNTLRIPIRALFREKNRKNVCDLNS